ncbi:MAG: flagellar biosynthesis anti-sigma factor FlgM [Treponema sp.]|jgi:negative regulator of flagellin synthesis FlgM|nr:flagellar biosynthesis anti-sigma factor FlgM [Treponema sp.]
MMIDRIGSVESIQPGKQHGPQNRVHSTVNTDSIVLSLEAREQGELYRAVELVSSAPDARQNRVAELKRKIQDPSYLNDTLIQSTADKIMKSFGF